MPTYEYACDACGHRFEEFQSIKAPPIKVCPVCGKKKVKRLISAGAGFIFKGSGFYETDYRSESYKEAAKKDAPKSEAAKGEGAKGGAAKAESGGGAKEKGGGAAAAPAKGDAPAAAPAKSESKGGTAPAKKAE